jgi:hypothetical protein
MNGEDSQSLTASCLCGAVTFETAGSPIMSVICHCTSCRTAGRRIEERPGAPAVLDAVGGTAFLLYRKDRLRCTRGSEKLETLRLKPDSPTRRLVARCCNAPMALEFSKGHWLSMYRDRFPDHAPPPEMRVMTADQPDDIPLPDDIPAYTRHSGRFMWRLLGAWIAMGLRIPRVPGLEAA